MPAKERTYGDDKLIISFTLSKSVHVCKIYTQQLRYACIEYQGNILLKSYSVGGWDLQYRVITDY